MEEDPGPEIEHHELRPFVKEERRRFRSSFLSTISSSECAISYGRFARSLVFVGLLVTCAPLIAGAAFTVIFFEDENYHALVAAFFSAVVSTGTISLFVLHLFANLESYHDLKTLEGIKVFGMLMGVFSGISLGVYVILAFLHKQSFSLSGSNYFSTSVFSGVCFACSLELYFTAQWYQNALRIAARLASITSMRPSTSAVL